MRVAARGRELDVREDGHIEPQGVAVQQRDARLDDAALLELLDAPPARGGGNPGLRRDLGDRQRAVAL